ncbi:MAG: hypothetical protein AAFV19_22515, partial [Pseudomonadota bacterium]
MPVLIGLLLVVYSVFLRETQVLACEIGEIIEEVSEHEQSGHKIIEGECLKSIYTGEQGSELDYVKYNTEEGAIRKISGIDNENFRIPNDQRRNLTDYEEYLRRLASLHNGRACLTERERDKKHPRLAKTDWATINGHAEAYACLTWIATSYQTASGFANWLAANGFRIKTWVVWHQSGDVEGWSLRFFLAGASENGPLYSHNFFDADYFRELISNKTFAIRVEYNLHQGIRDIRIKSGDLK